MSLIDIKPADLETVRRILSEHVTGLEVRAFGSRISWTARETSDLDLAIMTSRPMHFTQMARIEHAFSESNLPFRVDVVDWARTSTTFQKIIEQDYVVLTYRNTCEVESVATKIVKIVSTIDARMGLNTAMNRNLENIVQRLFRSWFVDFDPVHQKLVEYDTDYSPEISELFSGQLVDSSIGKIPEGWNWSDLGSEVNIAVGSSLCPSIPSDWNVDIAWAMPTDVSPNNLPVLFVKSPTITTEYLSQVTGGLSSVGAIILSSKMSRISVAIIDALIPPSENPIVMDCSGKLSHFFVWSWIRFLLDSISMDQDSSLSETINTQKIDKIPVIIPHESVLKAYDNVAENIYKYMQYNENLSCNIGDIKSCIESGIVAGSF